MIVTPPPQTLLRLKLGTWSFGYALALHLHGVLGGLGAVELRQVWLHFHLHHRWSGLPVDLRHWGSPLPVLDASPTDPPPAANIDAKDVQRT